MLMDQARQSRQTPQPNNQQQEGGFTPPDWREFTPPDQVDAVERIVAAGMRLIYSPEMRDQLQEAVASDAPVDQKLADNAVGLLLTLDQKSQGGIPVAALFPAGMALLGEAVQVLQSAGQQVTQENFNDAALRMFAVMGKKMGGTDDQILQAAQGAMGGGAAPGQPEPESPAEQATEPGEELGMQEGMR